MTIIFTLLIIFGAFHKLVQGRTDISICAVAEWWQYYGWVSKWDSKCKKVVGAGWLVE